MGFGWLFRLPLHYRGGEGAIRTLVASETQVQRWQSSWSCTVMEATMAESLTATASLANADSTWQGQEQQQQQEEAFGVSAAEVLLRRGEGSPTLSVDFSPNDAGPFAAYLLLIPAESESPTQGPPQPMGVIRLRGTGDLAVLTLEEFCGNKWPMDLLATLLPKHLPSELAIAATTAVKTTALPARATGAAAAAGATTKTTGRAPREPLVLGVGEHEVALRRAVKEALLPRVVDFGFVLVRPEERPHDTRKPLS